MDNQNRTILKLESESEVQKTLLEASDAAHAGVEEVLRYDLTKLGKRVDAE